jgi:hypothetical protein|nr:hypothetical protein [Aeromicrobium sp.]
MRRLVGALAAVLLLSAGCTAGSDPKPESEPSPSASPGISLTSLDLDWPRVDGKLEVSKPPSAPGGLVGDDVVERMGGVLVDWATASTVDADVWHSETPVDQVVDVLPASVAANLRKGTQGVVSRNLAFANVFADEVTVVGSPIVSTAWKISTEANDEGRQYVLLELQTRAAYEVRLGDDGPTTVIAMLRVHGVTAYPDTTGEDFGVSAAWREFGARGCSLVLDDSLVPAGNLDDTTEDLEQFVEVSDAEELVMPPLEEDQEVDSGYADRCRDSAT